MSKLSNEPVKVVAVLMTCHNERAKVLQSLSSLMSQKLRSSFKIEVFLTDAGSSDGTAEAVTERFPKVHVIPGDIDMFWVAGTNVSWHAAELELKPSFFLLLNSDTYFLEGGLQLLVDRYSKLSSVHRVPILLSGGCVEPGVGNVLSYGGSRRLFSALPFPLKPVRWGEFPIEVDSCTGNVLLVPRDLFLELGYLSSYLSHSYADTDYSLRASEHSKARLFICGVVATCSSDYDSKTRKSESLTFVERIRALMSSRGVWFRGKYFPPLHEYYIYCRSHFGWLWLVALIGKMSQLLLLQFFVSTKKKA